MILWKFLCGKIILIAIFLSFGIESQGKNIIFNKSHCVAWKTKKRMFLTHFIEPIGVNCSIKAQFKKEGSGFFIEVSAPIKSFDSKEPKRDKEIIKILKADIQPTLIIRTKSYSLKEWKSDWKSNKFKNKITIEIGKKRFPLIIEAQKYEERKSFILRGKVVTKFSHLSLSPPSFAWGLITRVSDYLELHYNLDVLKIDGFKKVIDNN